jgi:hypothetical protein
MEINIAPVKQQTSTYLATKSIEDSTPWMANNSSPFNKTRAIVAVITSPHHRVLSKINPVNMLISLSCLKSLLLLSSYPYRDRKKLAESLSRNTWWINKRFIGSRQRPSIIWGNKATLGLMCLELSSPFQ